MPTVPTVCHQEVENEAFGPHGEEAPATPQSGEWGPAGQEDARMGDACKDEASDSSSGNNSQGEDRMAAMLQKYLDSLDRYGLRQAHPTCCTNWGS